MSNSPLQPSSPPTPPPRPVPPPLSPSTLNYAKSAGAAAPNTPKKFFLRALAGFAAVLIALAVGFALYIIAISTGNSHLDDASGYIFFSPLVGLFLFALVVTIWKRRFGYLTGMITATVLAFLLATIALILFVLYLIYIYRRP